MSAELIHQNEIFRSNIIPRLPLLQRKKSTERLKRCKSRANSLVPTQLGDQSAQGFGAILKRL